MQEMDKGLDLSFAGAEAERALVAFRQQMDAWQIATPPVPPVVLDFGLGQFDHVGLIEYWIANEIDAGYCGKYLFVFDGQQCPAHSHRTKHETFFTVRGRLRVVLDGKPVILDAGQVLAVAPGHVHSFQGEGNSLLLELSMPCQVSDNFFEDPRIMEWLKRSIGP
jgi:D-lyxose ketol-isomerase